MGWPTPQDYNEAVQSPQSCFSDPELKQGKPALTPLGLPKPITGAFASVYQLDCPNRRWAVRCFLREFADQERRYSAISERLGTVKLPCMVGFEYLVRGILVRGQWFPILKMEWIDGVTINDYMSRNLNHRQVLQSLSRQWIDLMGSLRRAHIAHGDLQHGNILVSGSDLRLIDYDAMYVPALAGLASHEEGHRNFQHPGRTGKDYHPDLDNFSAWVIFASISALAIEPGFWKVLNAGDECLLFRREDFEKPRTSKALQTLEKNGNLQLKALVSHFRTILSLPLSQIPSLDGSVLDNQSQPEPKAGQLRPTEIQTLPSWLHDHIDHKVRHAELELFTANEPGAQISGAGWLYDHLIDDGILAPPRLPIIPRRDRIALWSCLGILGFMVVAWAAFLISTLAFAGIILLVFGVGSTILFYGYRATGPAPKRLVIRAHIDDGRRSLAQIESVIDLTRIERGRLGERLFPLKEAYEKLPQMSRAEALQLDRELARKLDGIQARRRNFKNDEEAAIRAIDAEAERLEANKAKALKIVDARRHKAQKDHDMATRALVVETEQLDRERAMALEQIEEQRRKAEQDKKAAIIQIDRRTKTSLGLLIQKRGSLPSEEKAEIDRALQQLRSSHLKLALSQARLTSSSVSGIGEALADRLRAAGVSRASDITYDRVRRVSGIGEAKSNALVAWRKGVESGANSTAPSSLSETEKRRIQAQYEASRQSIERQIASSKDEEQRQRLEILQKQSASRITLDAESAMARRDYDAKQAALEAKNNVERKRLDQELISMRQMVDAEEATTKRAFDAERESQRTTHEMERQRTAAEAIEFERSLVAEEQAAKLEHSLQRDAVRAKFDKEKDRLIAEYKTEKLRAEEKRKTLDEKHDELNRSLFQRRLEVRNAELELARLVDIKPMFYLRMVMLSGWRLSA